MAGAGVFPAPLGMLPTRPAGGAALSLPAPQRTLPRSPAPPPPRRWASPLAVLLLGVLVLVAAALARQALPLPQEVEESRAVYTMRQELTERVRAGEGAEWLHDVGFGTPGARLATWGLWSVFHLPAWALPFPMAWTVGAGLRLLAAVAGAWALTRRLRAGPVAATVAALAAAAGVLALGIGMPRSDVFALAPSLAWAVSLLLRREAPWWHGAVLVAFSMATWLAGSPVAALAACLACLPVIAWQLWRRRDEGARRLWRPVAAVLGGISLGVGLASFTLLPTLELMRDPASRAVVRAAQQHPGGPLRPPALRLVPAGELMPHPPQAARLAAASVRGRIGATRAALPPHAGLPHGIAAVAPEALEDPRARQIRDRTGLRSAGDGQWAWAGADASRLRAWLGSLGIGAVVEGAGRDAQVRDIRPALPTVLVTAGVLPASEGGAVHAVERSGVEGLLRNTVVEPYEDQPLEDLPGGDGTARLASSSRAGGHVTARVQSDRGAVLVSLDRALPGWQARVDGRRDTVLRANALFVGAPVPPGTHLVELRYEPPGAVAGVVTSTRSLGAVPGWLLLRWLRERTGMSTRQLLLTAAEEGQRRWIHRGSSDAGRVPSDVGRNSPRRR